MEVLASSISQNDFGNIKYIIENGGKINSVFSFTEKEIEKKKNIKKNKNTKIQTSNEFSFANNYTPLTLSIKFNLIEIVKLLIKKNVSLDSFDNYGNNPLILSIDISHFEIANLLIQKGAKVNVTDVNDNTPLRSALVKKNMEITKLLIQKGAKADYKPNIFKEAINCKDIKVLELLMKDIKNKLILKNALLDSISMGLEELTDILLKNDNLDVNHSNNNQTPLTVSISIGNYSLVKMLLKKGANVNYENEKPLSLAIKNKNFLMIDLLINYGARINNISILNQIIISNNEKLTNYLVENYVDLNAKNSEFPHIIFHLYKTKNYNLINRLIETKRLNLNSLDQHGNNILFYAVKEKDDKNLELFIKYGAKIHLNNGENKPAFKYIVGYNQKLKTVFLNSHKILLNHGKQFDEFDTNFDFLIKCHEKVVKFYL
jgi:uncharacterized protein